MKFLVTFIILCAITSSSYIYAQDTGQTTETNHNSPSQEQESLSTRQVGDILLGIYQKFFLRSGYPLRSSRIILSVSSIPLPAWLQSCLFRRLGNFAGFYEYYKSRQIHAQSISLFLSYQA